MSRLSDERITELWIGSSDSVAFAKAIEHEAYKQGQERMKERAAERLESEHSWISREAGSALIRNLEIEEPK